MPATEKVLPKLLLRNFTQENSVLFLMTAVILLLVWNTSNEDRFKVAVSKLKLKPKARKDN
jgi:hypothetical protein